MIFSKQYLSLILAFSLLPSCVGSTKVAARPPSPGPQPLTPSFSAPPILKSPARSDSLVLRDVISNKIPSFGNPREIFPAQPDTNQSFISTVFDLVDTKPDGILEKDELLAAYIGVQKAQFSNDLKFDFNLDRVVDQRDCAIIKSLYFDLRPGLNGKFKLQ